MASKRAESSSTDPAPPRSAGSLAVADRPPEADDRWDSVASTNGLWPASNARGWRLAMGRLTAVRAPSAHWPGVRLDDVWADACDFANGDWTGGSLRRVDVRDCRFTGANLSECQLTDVRLTGCKLGQVAAHSAVLTRCRFDNCDLREADFEGADLRGAVFTRCDLRLARLGGALLDGTDLRGCHVAGLTADPTRLRGLVIDASQAVNLIELIGAVVKPPQP